MTMPIDSTIIFAHQEGIACLRDSVFDGSRAKVSPALCEREEPTGTKKRDGIKKRMKVTPVPDGPIQPLRMVQK